MLRFLQEKELFEHVDPVQLSLRLLVPPGSLLLKNDQMIPHLGKLDQAGFSYNWKHPDSKMDHLYQDVSRMVSEDTRQSVEPAVTYSRVWKTVEGTEIRFDPQRKKPPRLTESWYC